MELIQRFVQFAIKLLLFLMAKTGEIGAVVMFINSIVIHVPKLFLSHIRLLTTHVLYVVTPSLLRAAPATATTHFPTGQVMLTTTGRFVRLVSKVSIHQAIITMVIHVQCVVTRNLTIVVSI